MDSECQRFIDQIRREKFGIGTMNGNPLAAMLHIAIVNLLVELYQDIHFISELLQVYVGTFSSQGLLSS